VFDPGVHGVRQYRQRQCVTSDGAFVVSQNEISIAEILGSYNRASFFSSPHFPFFLPPASSSLNLRMNIGPYTLANNLFVGPDGGVTDRPFRQLCKAAGCRLCGQRDGDLAPDLWNTPQDLAPRQP
jgi:hypothetical protein